jgi:hypothetical protein
MTPQSKILGIINTQPKFHDDDDDDDDIHAVDAHFLLSLSCAPIKPNHYAPIIQAREHACYPGACT